MKKRGLIYTHKMCSLNPIYTRNTLKKVLITPLILLIIISVPFQLNAGPLAKDKDKFLGNIVRSGSEIPSDFDNYWNQVTPEESGMWVKIEPKRDEMQWDELDRIYNYAKEKNFSFREHCFVWGPPLGEPDWLCSLPENEQKEEVEEWIRLFGERYPDADYINVVNNPLKDIPCYKDAIDGNGDTGWDWVMWSFEKARKYCPNSKLLINQYGVLNGWVPMEDYLKIINLLKDRNLIDGIGIEGHFLEKVNINPVFLYQLASTELPIYVTGYDVKISDDTEQLKKYQEQFPILWQCPAVKGITLWGYREGEMLRKEAFLIRVDGTKRPALKWLREYLSQEHESSPIPTLESTTSSQSVIKQKFGAISPQEAVKSMSPGWSLGDTLDAEPTEGAWGNSPVKEHIFDDIRRAGFNTVRIPVTWTHHIYPLPEYKIDPEWFNRVEEVVDWALERDFWVVLDAHHDNDWFSEMVIEPKTGEYKSNYDNTIVKLEKLWEQIAGRFKWKSEKLIFQILNEPLNEDWDIPGETKHGITIEQVNDMNRRILKIIRSSGGYNDKRLVIVSGLLNSIGKTLKFFEMPDDEHIILSIHYYSPWQFLQNLWGTVTWGTEEDKKIVENVFKRFQETFIKNRLPIVITEWGWISLKIDRLSSWYYHDYLAKTAYKYGVPWILWDDGKVAYFDREDRVWRDKTLKDIVINAASGISNPFIFPADNYFRIDAPIEDLTVKVELNDNKLIDIYNYNRKLIKGRDYVLDNSGSKITIKKEYLKSLLNTGKLGTVATLTFAFSPGVDIPLSIIQYDLPKFQKKSITVEKGNAQSDVIIPVIFNGTKLATVGVVDETDGKPVKYSWTPYVDMGKHFDYNEGEVILKKEILKELKGNSLFTFKFWPEEVEVEIEAKVLKDE